MGHDRYGQVRRETEIVVERMCARAPRARTKGGWRDMAIKTGKLTTEQRANENVYAIIEGQRGAGGKTLRLFTSATACLTAFFDGGYEGRAHFKKVS